MSNAEHNEWLLEEKERKERLEAERKKKHLIAPHTPGAVVGNRSDTVKKSRTSGGDEDEENSEEVPGKWTEPTDDAEYYL